MKLSGSSQILVIHLYDRPAAIFISCIQKHGGSSRFPTIRSWPPEQCSRSSGKQILTGKNFSGMYGNTISQEEGSPQSGSNVWIKRKFLCRDLGIPERRRRESSISGVLWLKGFPRWQIQWQGGTPLPGGFSRNPSIPCDPGWFPDKHSPAGMT